MFMLAIMNSFCRAEGPRLLRSCNCSMYHKSNTSAAMGSLLLLSGLAPTAFLVREQDRLCLKAILSNASRDSLPNAWCTNLLRTDILDYILLTYLKGGNRLQISFLWMCFTCLNDCLNFRNSDLTLESYLIPVSTFRSRASTCTGRLRPG